MKLLVTGGAGFIGSAFIRHIIAHTPHHVVNVDALTYAGNPQSLASVVANTRYVFERADVCDAIAMDRIFSNHQPDAVLHLAAESHVDHSITRPAAFIHTNIVGTYTLLQSACTYWQRLSGERRRLFRFHHVSTDEVYGDLFQTDDLFTENTPYAPSSPYSASKASADHLVRAWHRTYGLPVVISTCTNNYGPFQHHEKLIPLMIQRALKGQSLPVYGRGHQVRDWLYVDDHVRALYRVLTQGWPGHTYNVGANNERRNLDVVRLICRLLDQKHPRHSGSYEQLITFVADRPGHDQRYAIDATKVRRELGWSPQEPFETGLKKTIDWWLAPAEQGVTVTNQGLALS